jgi:type II secretory pathway pseudopilin PulG
MNIIKTNRRALQSGTTLVELSVVIAVILLLVSVLFIGVTAWKNSANRAACLVNLATLQKAVRGYQNANADNSAITGLANGMKDLTDAGYFPAPGPVCPQTQVAYTAAAVNPFPGPGVAAFTCATATHAPSAANLANW